MVFQTLVCELVEDTMAVQDSCMSMMQSGSAMSVHRINVTAGSHLIKTSSIVMVKFDGDTL